MNAAMRVSLPQPQPSLACQPLTTERPHDMVHCLGACDTQTLAEFGLPLGDSGGAISSAANSGNSQHQPQRSLHVLACDNGCGLGDDGAWLALPGDSSLAVATRKVRHSFLWCSNM